MPETSMLVTGIPGPVRFRPVADGDETALADIFNYYVEHSLAAFPDRPVPVQGVHALLMEGASLASLAAVLDDGRGGGIVAGFGLLRPHSRFSTFAHTAEITAFLAPGRTGLGIGHELYRRLFDEGRRLGVRRVLACIAEPNAGSLRFHAAQGFRECGRFPGVMRKAGLEVDIVWMVKTLD